MPVKKTSSFLKDSSLRTIGFYFVIKWVFRFNGMRDFFNGDVFQLNLTSSQLETLILSVFQFNIPPPLSCWRFLINLRLENLKLRNCLSVGPHHVETVLLLASQRCYKLKKLSLRAYNHLMVPIPLCPTIWENVVPDALCHFPMLWKLDLTGSFATDRVLDKLGKHCIQLRVLKATNCLNITDAGIRYLCDPQHDASGTIVGGHCLRIEKLYLNGTGVTLGGIQLALVNLPQLQVLSHDRLLQGLATLNAGHMMTERGTQLPLLDHIFPALTSLFYGGEVYSNNLFSDALRRVNPCNISELVLTVNNDMTDLSLQAFVILKNLKQLSIIDSCNSQVTFNEGILPVLEAVGRNLEHLLIQNGRMIRVRAIARVCPQLSSLNLKRNRSYINSIGRELNANFIHLEKVTLDHVPNVNFTSADLGAIFLSPSLKSILISDCDSLNDVILETANCQHNFCHLKTLHFTRCNTVTNIGIDLLMNEKNPLEECLFIDCNFITNDHIITWQRQARTRNWNLTCPQDLPPLINLLMLN